MISTCLRSGTHQDKFYGLDPRLHVYDVTKPKEPKLITTIQGARA